MIKSFRYFSIFLLPGLLQVYCAGLKPKPYLGSNTPAVRVLLQEGKSIQVPFAGDFKLEGNNHRVNSIKNETLLLEYTNNAGQIDVFRAGKKIARAGKISFIPRHATDHYSIGKKSYRGALVCIKNIDQIQVISSVDIETYLKSVVPAEIGRLDETAYEALKAQAVAARTYVLNRLKTRTKKNNFDVSSGIGDQVYSGHAAGYRLADRAVEETRGKVLLFNNTLAEVFFHSTCGGRTEFGYNIFTSIRHPYLTGVADNFGQDDFCSGSPFFRWTEVFLLDEIEKNLRIYFNDRYKKVAGMGGLSDIIIKERFPSGRVKKIDLIFGSNRHKLSFTGEQARRVFRKKDGILLRSSLFKILKDESFSKTGKIQIVGAGNGHGVGMCQWGAIGMAKQGYDFEQILGHYFRGAEIGTVY